MLTLAAVELSSGSSGSCPFDELPCEHVDSCDEVLVLLFGLPLPCSVPVLLLRCVRGCRDFG